MRSTLPTSPKTFFGRGGLLSRALEGYEERPSQARFSEAVEETLSDGGVLLAEAGTGTGKTLAYLLPAVDAGRRVVVSTGTKNLQEQLVSKDIPLLARALGRDLSVAVMKGRGKLSLPPPPPLLRTGRQLPPPRRDTDLPRRRGLGG